jgi:hypothetical protein
MAEKKAAPKKGNEGKTVTVRQIRSANRKPAVGSRHDQRGQAPRRDRRRRQVR